AVTTTSQRPVLKKKEKPILGPPIILQTGNPTERKEVPFRNFLDLSLSRICLVYLFLSKKPSIFPLL
ncbi:Uncharacterized protein TCM_027417 isoform 2, partial [Theobroma cacao]